MERLPGPPVAGIRVARAQLGGVAGEVVQLTAAAAVLDPQPAPRADRAIGEDPAHGLLARVDVGTRHEAPPARLVQQRPPGDELRVAREAEERTAVHHLAGLAPAIWRIVGARSMLPTSSPDSSPGGMPGPRMSSGTRVDGS